MTNWVLTHCVGSVRKISFKFPENFILKSKQSVKLWASSSRTSNQSNSKFSSGNNSKTASFSCSSSQTSSSSSIGSSKSNGFYLNGSSNGNKETSNGHNSLISSSTENCLNGNDTMTYTDTSIENELIIYDIENWTCGSQEIFIRIENEFGEEKASFRKTK